MPNQLEPYQETFVENILTALEKDNAILAQLSTGGGKTVVFARIVNDYIKKENRDVLIAVHRQELLKQTSRILFNWHNVGSEKIDINNKHIKRSRVYVGMVETLKNRLKDTKTFNLMKNVGLVIIDEAHMSNFKKIFPHFPKEKIIGFTATPIHATKKDPINKYYDDIVVGCSIGELIGLNQSKNDRGLVQNLTYSIANINRNELDKHVKGDEFDEEYMGKVFSKKKQIQNTINAYNKYSLGKKTICFNVNVAHSKLVTEEMINAGLNAKHLDGGHDEAYRAECFRWLKNTPDAILCNVGIATTGFDEPSIETVIVNSAMKSLSYWLQKCGRGARPCMDINKRKFIILDLGGNAFAHGDWNAERDWKDIFHNPYIPRNGKAPVKSCDNCGVVNAAAARTCKNCGFEFPLPSAEEDTVERNLVLITKGANVERIIEQFKDRPEYDSFREIIKSVAKIARNSIGVEILDELELTKWQEIMFRNVEEWAAIKGKTTKESYIIDSRYKLNRELAETGLIINFEKKIPMQTNEPIEIPGFENYTFSANGGIFKKPNEDNVEYINGYATITNGDGINMNFSRADIEDLIAQKLFTEQEYEESKTAFIEAFNNGFLNQIQALQLINAERKIWEAKLEDLEENTKVAWAEARHGQREKATEYLAAAHDADDALDVHKSNPYGDIHALISEQDKKLKEEIEKLRSKSDVINKILTSNFKDGQSFLPKVKRTPSTTVRIQNQDASNEKLVEGKKIQLHRPRLGILATGKILSNGRVEILVGSTIKKDISDWFRQNRQTLVEQRKEYESDGTIVNATFRKPAIFKTTSGAATFILGSSANGNKEWEIAE